MNAKLAAALAISLTSVICCVSAAAEKKNILLIIADDYGADSSNLYNSTNAGAQLPPTPNVASLVTNGVVFRKAYAYPVCSPTRSCLLTGQFGFRTGIGTVVDNGPSLTTSAFTLPKAFTNAATGYALAQFGKWHLAFGPNTPRTVGGWTNFAGSLPGAIQNYTNWIKLVNGTSTANYTNYATTDLVNDATAWVSARGTNAWFAWVAFNAPHTPLHLPPTNLCPHYATLPGTTADINARPTLYYDAMVEAMDTEIGRLLASVDRSKTHIIFLGDNGTPPNTLQPPYPGGRGKDTLYEGGVRVPFIISGPAVVNPNRTNDTLVNMVDVFATILEMVGTSVGAAVPASAPIDGQSLLPALQADTVLSRRAYSELFGTNYTASESGRMLRDDRYKLIRYTDGHELFYDLLNDPYENTNLIGSLSATQQAYHDRLEFWLYGYSTNTGPRIASSAWSNGQFSCSLTQAASYALWRCGDLTTLFWSQVTNSIMTTNGANVILTDPSPPPTGRAFYSVVK